MQDYGWMAAEWIPAEVRVPDHAGLFAALERRRDAVCVQYPHVAVRRPKSGRAERPLLTAGGLVTLWERWSALTGPCRACGGRVLGNGFNGLLSRADAFGVCVDCARAQRRPIQGGIATALSNANRALEGTGFRCGSPWAAPSAEPYADLIAALQELGELRLHRDVGAAGPEFRPSSGPDIARGVDRDFGPDGGVSPPGEL